jgi:hypothetical protein
VLAVISEIVVIVFVKPQLQVFAESLPVQLEILLVVKKKTIL